MVATLWKPDASDTTQSTPPERVVTSACDDNGLVVLPQIEGDGRELRPDDDGAGAGQKATDLLSHPQLVAEVKAQEAVVGGHERVDGRQIGPRPKINVEHEHAVDEVEQGRVRGKMRVNHERKGRPPGPAALAAENPRGPAPHVGKWATRRSRPPAKSL